MLKGIGTGLSSAVGMYMFFHKELESFYVSGMREVLGIDVTLGSFFVLMALAGGITEVLRHVSYWMKCFAIGNREKARAKNVQPAKQSTVTTTVTTTKQPRQPIMQKPEQPSNLPVKPNEPNEPSRPSKPVLPV